MCEENNAKIRQKISAMFEENIEPEDFISELKPLIEEYFICELADSGDGLEVLFFNGQKFLLKAEKLN